MKKTRRGGQEIANISRDAGKFRDLNLMTYNLHTHTEKEREREMETEEWEESERKREM